MKKSTLCFIVFLILTFQFFLSTSFASKENEFITYKLAISFDIEKQQLHGTGHLTLAAGQDITLTLSNVEITGLLVKDNLSPPTTLKQLEMSQLTIPPKRVRQEVFFSFIKNTSMDVDNFIDKDGITLIDSWHPLPSKDVVFSLTAEVPQGFLAIAESDHITPVVGNTHTFFFSQQTSSLNFIAAPFTIDTLEVRPGLKVYTFFYEQDRELANTYLKAASEYLHHYEKLLGPYPYNHFAIVENIRPTGYGMPTFTLLGKQVIRLPFIVSTSLGHEILHSWFGNAIRVKEASANWTEGLTSYLADWAYKDRDGEGSVNRKENIIKYLSYVDKNNSIALGSFRSASHNQPLANTVRAVGYTRGAMLFHELKQRIGSKKFEEAIALFYKKFKGKRAGWLDIKETFEEIAQLPLDSFFTERLDRADIPELEVTGISTDSSSGSFTLAFDLIQKTSPPYHILVPIVVETSSGPVKFIREISSAQQRIELQLESSPQNLNIDPGYDLLRRLDNREMVPSWSQMLGTSQKTIVIRQQDRDLYLPLLNLLSQQNSTIVDINEIQNSDLEENNLIFLGTDNILSRSLFGQPEHPKNGFTLDMRTHPLNGDKIVMLVSCSDRIELKAVVNRLSHYGKYTYLHFENGKVMTKKSYSGIMGQQHPLENSPIGAVSSSFFQFSDLISDLEESRAIYIGEMHTSMTDHHLQFRIVEELYRQNPELAIGMEMFPHSSQKVLDDYILKDETMTEEDFLKQSRYFHVWKYDYRYYRNIINFARKHNIRLLGINIDRNITSEVFKTGSTDSLEEEQLALLPIDRRLDMEGYQDRLSATHSMHLRGQASMGKFGGFIQAQGIWDETMAQNIADYLKNNQKKRMVILAGAQHTRNDSGIPPRVFRRIAVKQKSILNGNSHIRPSQSIADFYLFTNEMSLPPPGKIGITLEKMEEDGEHFLQITQLSPHSNAEKSGLKENDKLLAINDYSIKDMEDVRIAMIDGNPGDNITVAIERLDESLKKQQLTVTVELYQPIQGH